MKSKIEVSDPASQKQMNQSLHSYTPAFAASKISGLWKRSRVRYRRQYIHTCETIQPDF